MASEHSTSQPIQSLISALAHLGWGVKKSPELQRFSEALGRHDSVAKQSHWTALSLPDGRALIVVCTPQRLSGFEETYKKYEDLTPHHRRVLNWLGEDRLSGPFVLILDEVGGDLLDRDSEEVLLHVQTRSEWQDRLLPLLSLPNLAAGSLLAFPRKTERRHAQELAHWTQIHSAELGASAGATQADMTLFFQALHLARSAMVNGFGPALKKATPAKQLQQLFHFLQEELNLLQGVQSSRLSDIALHSKSFDSIWQSYFLLSRNKFSARLFARAFGGDELKHLAEDFLLRLSADQSLESYFHLDEWVYEPIRFDLDEYGYEVLLDAFDALVNQARRESHDRVTSLERGERPGMQLDLLSGEPPVYEDRDAVTVVLRQGIVIRTEDAHRRNLARMILLARACEWNHKLEVRSPVFPSIKAEMKRVNTISESQMSAALHQLN